MKDAKKNNKNRRLGPPEFQYNKDLDKYQGEVLFPEKLARANQLLKGVKLPSVKKS